ncbi:hypothetical protein, partial [Parafrankia sp. FMc2]|uniref:hypothetical protein n=1 Tax=Parafrankia sp. FMc2 TaxID=3233196 RepID=UPI0034D5D8F9
GGRGAPDPAPAGPQRPAEATVGGPENVDGLQVSVARAGSPAGVEVTFDRTSRTADGSPVPAAARRFVFLFDEKLRFNPSAFPTCSRETVDTHGVEACPAGSRVGSAQASYPDGSQASAVAVNSRVAGRAGVVLAFPSTGAVLEQTLEPVSAPYRGRYRWALDELLPPTSTPPQDRPGTTRFVITFGAVTSAGGRPVSYVDSTDPRGVHRFGLWSEFVTGQVLVPADRVVPRR